MTNRRHFLASTAAALAGCSRKKPGLGPIRVSHNTELTVAPLYVALEQGYFAGRGLRIETVEFHGSQAIPLLAGGKLDVSLGVISPTLVNAVARGARVRIVAGRQRASVECGDFSMLLARKELFPDGVFDLRRLKGKRIAVGRPGSISSFAIDLELRGAGLTRNDVTFVYMGYPEIASALASGAIDAGTMVNDMHVDVSVLDDVVLRGPGIGACFPNYQYTFILFGKRMLAADPAYGAAFLAAYLRGNRDFLAGKMPKFALELAKTEHLDLPRVPPGCSHMFSPAGEIDRPSLEAYLDWIVREGFADRPVSANDVVDERFLDLAHKMSGNTAGAS